MFVSHAATTSYSKLLYYFYTHRNLPLQRPPIELLFNAACQSVACIEETRCWATSCQEAHFKFHSKMPITFLLRKCNYNCNPLAASSAFDISQREKITISICKSISLREVFSPLKVSNHFAQVQIEVRECKFVIYRHIARSLIESGNCRITLGPSQAVRLLLLAGCQTLCNLIE